tara:strand:+ start:295 stop:678 length:384 start_codon:yes stop_codon:yes gene_type:complete
MKSRCYRRGQDPTTKYWRFVEVCEEWRNSFDTFLKDMGEKPDGMTLDRIDGTKGYNPSNCRWASRTTQSRNTRLRLNNTSGHKGVCRKRDKWRAYISVDGVQQNLGTFNTQAEAVAARKHGEQDYWK